MAPPAALIGVVAGTLLGLTMGYYGGRIDDGLSRIVEAFLALPVILVALLTLVVLGSSTIVVIGVVGILFTPIVARTVRSAVLTERRLDYVTSAKLRGESGLFIMVREIFPNIQGPIVVELTVRLGYAIFTVATLSFLGVGHPATVARLGPPDLGGVQQHDRRDLVDDPLPGAGHRHHGRRGQPDRGRPPIGVLGMTMTASPPTPDPAPTVAALKVEDLELAYLVRGIPRPVLRGVSFEIAPGEAYGLVGESGCGKSTTAYAAVRYLPRNGRITGGRILIAGEDITRMSNDEVRRFRTHHASMVYQDPGSALNPSTRVGPQVIEAFTVLGQDAKSAHDNALAALARVQIADPERVFYRYPHQLSGGMQQRVVIAMALASDPQLLVLDEPTTGLDATVEASVLDLVRSLRAETNAAVLLIAHNLGVIRSICDRVGVMYAGKIVEEGSALEVFEAPKHPYTVGLLQSLPRHGVRKSQRPLATIPGTLPQIGTPLPTCVFVDRCALATDLCRTVVPPVVPVGDGRWSRCHHIDRIGELVEQGAARRLHVRRRHRTDAHDDRRLEDLPPVRPRRPGPRQGGPRTSRR